MTADQRLDPLVVAELDAIGLAAPPQRRDEEADSFVRAAPNRRPVRLHLMTEAAVSKRTAGAAAGGSGGNPRTNSFTRVSPP